MKLILVQDTIVQKSAKPYFVSYFDTEKRFTSKNECIHFINSKIRFSAGLDYRDFKVCHDLPNKDTVQYSLTSILKDK